MSARTTRSTALTRAGTDGAPPDAPTPNAGVEGQNSADMDATSKSMYLSVATGRAFPYVAQWMIDRSREMQTTARALERDSNGGPLMAEVCSLQKAIVDSRAAREVKRNKVFQRLQTMQLVRRHQHMAGDLWLKGFQEASTTYLSELQKMREELLERKKLADDWTLCGKRDAMLANLMQIKKQQEMLLQRLQRDVAKKTARRVQTLHNVREAMERLVGEVGDAVTWELQQQLHGHPVTRKGVASRATATVMSVVPADERKLLAKERQLRTQLRQLEQQRCQGRQRKHPSGTGTTDARRGVEGRETVPTTRRLLSPPSPESTRGHTSSPVSTTVAVETEANVATTLIQQQHRHHEEEKGEEGKDEKKQQKREHCGGASVGTSGGSTLKLPPLEQQREEPRIAISNRGNANRRVNIAPAAAPPPPPPPPPTTSSSSSRGGGGGTLPSMHRRGYTAARPPVVLPPTNIRNNASGRHSADHLAGLLAVLSEDTAHLAASRCQMQEEVQKLREELRGHKEETARLLRLNIDLERQRAQLLVQRDAQKERLKQGVMEKKSSEDMRSVDIQLLNAELLRTLEMLQAQLEKRRSETERARESIMECRRKISEQDALMQQVCEYWRRNAVAVCHGRKGEKNDSELHFCVGSGEVSLIDPNDFVAPPPLNRILLHGQPSAPQAVVDPGHAGKTWESFQPIPALGLQKPEEVAEFLYCIFEEPTGGRKTLLRMNKVQHE